MSMLCGGILVIELSVPDRVAVAIQTIVVVGRRVSTGAAKLQVIVRDVARRLQDSFQRG